MGTVQNVLVQLQALGTWEIAGTVAAAGAGYLAYSYYNHKTQEADAIRRRNSSSTYKPPKIDEVAATVEKLRNAFNSGRSKPLQWRLEQLRQLKNMITYNREELVTAVQKDLGKKHPQEVVASEINLVLSEIDHVIAELPHWVVPEKVYTPIGLQPGKSFIYKDPVGVVLIMSPWNYPINLALVPLMGAIAAGNCVFLKVSRHSANTAAALTSLIPKYLDMEAIAVEGDGGANYITELIKYKYDHVFFTGSVSVGKIVYEAAAKHLTPCTLELGGKNPCIVDDTVDPAFAARRIAWGKFFNAGQTCVGVDYVLVKKEIKAKLIEELKKVVTQFYGANPKESQSFARIISSQHAERLGELMQCGDVVVGGQVDVKERYVAPTIIDNVKLETKLMTDEIFGPVMPIIAVDSIDEAIQFVGKRPTPLALYLFSTAKATQDKVLSSTRSGAALINEVVLHFTNSCLPFGGCGESGLGAYHGKLTFDTFCHKRAVVKSTSSKILDLPFRYPPYTNLFYWMVDKVTRSGW